MKEPHVSLQSIPPTSRPKRNGETRFYKRLLQQRTLAMMCIPFVVWAFMFKYLPLWGWTMAFQNFKPEETLQISSGWE